MSFRRRISSPAKKSHGQDTHQFLIGVVVTDYTLFCLCVITGLSLGLLTQSCKETPPEPPKPSTLSFTAEDASCTEAWLKVSCTERPATLRLLREGQPVSVIGLRSPDSLVINEGLLPRHTYTYQLQRLGADSSVIETSPSVQVTTMDTSSHAWHFEIDTLGVTSSVLYDVAIISENNVWAVGEIFLNDTSGRLDPVRYNVVHWDGTRWEASRVYSNCRLYWPNCGPVIMTVSPGKAVYAFGPDDVWIVAGGVHHFDGTRWTEHRALVEIASTNKMWGSNTNDVWFVGNGGLIVHYNGSAWQRVESGTTLPIMGVYGARNNQSGQYEILCVAEAYGVPGGSKILAIENTGVHEVTTNSLESWGVEGIWFVPNRYYIVIGQGVWRSGSPEGNWWFVDTLPSIATTSISGQRLNDVTVCGAFWLLGHWNGVSWHTYFQRTSGSFTSVQMMGNLLMAVGGIGNRAFVVRASR